MEDKKTKSDKTSVNIFALGLIVMFVFSILRLANVLVWHWVWITVPFWGAIVLVMSISLAKSIIKDVKLWRKSK